MTAIGEVEQRLEEACQMLDDTEQEVAQSVTEGEHRREALKQQLRDVFGEGEIVGGSVDG